MTESQANSADIKLKWSPYQYALRLGSLEIINKLEEIGGKYGDATAKLLLASKENTIDVVEAFIRAGANIDLLTLQYATIYNSVDVIELLISAGADIHAKEMYNVTLHHLVVSIRGSDDQLVEVLKTLNKYGIDKTAKITQSLPWHAPSYIQDHGGFTAYDIAKARKLSNEILELLK